MHLQHGVRLGLVGDAGGGGVLLGDVERVVGLGRPGECGEELSGGDPAHEGEGAVEQVTRDGAVGQFDVGFEGRQAADRSGGDGNGGAEVVVLGLDEEPVGRENVVVAGARLALGGLVRASLEQVAYGVEGGGHACSMADLRLVQ